MATVNAIAACTSIYYPAEGWGRGIDTTLYPMGPAFDEEMAREQARFRPDLIDCISRFDPDNVHEMDNGGTYRFGGRFVPGKRFGPGSVRACMEQKGWQPVPK